MTTNKLEQAYAERRRALKELKEQTAHQTAFGCTSTGLPLYIYSSALVRAYEEIARIKETTK